MMNQIMGTKKSIPSFTGFWKMGNYSMAILSLMIISLIYSPPTLLFAQCPMPVPDTLAYEDFEKGLPLAWAAPQAQDGGTWAIDEGVIGLYPNPGQGKWLYISDEKNDDIGVAVLTTAQYDLRSYGPESKVEFDISFQEFTGKGEMKVEAWDGAEWYFLYKEEDDFHGHITIILKEFLIEDFQLRFTYSDGNAWAWGMGIDNFVVKGIQEVCEDKVCDRSETPSSCATDCPLLAYPNPYWIPLGKNLEGGSVKYNNFKGTTPCDDCSQEIQLPFEFRFFDQYVSTIHLNSNGNITIEQKFIEFTPKPFCLQGPQMIAPFYGDVDLNEGGTIHYYLDPAGHYAIITWNQVSYYGCEGEECNKHNSFQCIITDGSLKTINGGEVPSNSNIVFVYGEMSWTTGNASKGVNGFSGSAATVGINKGDGEQCDDYGTFDHEGFDYYGNSQTAKCPPNGVNHLDNSVIWVNAQEGSVIQQGDILTLEGFPGKQENTLRWSVQQSQAIEAFILERSLNGTDFAQVDIIPAKAGQEHLLQSYSFTDSDISMGISYYRIHIMETNGSHRFSEVVPIENNWQELPFTLLNVSPNPFQSKISISYQTESESQVHFRLTDTGGRVLVQGERPGEIGTGEILLQPGNLPSGLYLLHIYGNWGSVYKQLVRE